MVTKLPSGKPIGAEYGLPVWLFLKFKISPACKWTMLGSLRWNKFRGLQWSSVFDMPGSIAQIFDNLVGCSKEELVSTLS
jgi:hypothetical protein